LTRVGTAHGAGRGDGDVLGHARGEAQRYAGLHLVVQRHLVGEFHGAVRVDDLNLPLGSHDAGVLVIGQLVGAQGAVVVADLDRTFGDVDPGLVVAGDLVGFHVELAFGQTVGGRRSLGGPSIGRLGVGRAAPQERCRRTGEERTLGCG
jgi:hypothetical protein